MHTHKQTHISKLLLCLSWLRISFVLFGLCHTRHFVYVIAVVVSVSRALGKDDNDNDDAIYWSKSAPTCHLTASSEINIPTTVWKRSRRGKEEEGGLSWRVISCKADVDGCCNHIK